MDVHHLLSLDFVCLSVAKFGIKCGGGQRFGSGPSRHSLQVCHRFCPPDGAPAPQTDALGAATQAASIILPKYL